MGPRENAALNRVIKPLTRNGICTFAYDSERDVFYFGAKRQLYADALTGFVLPVDDAARGNWRKVKPPTR